jgi:hypothetical protein
MSGRLDSNQQPPGPHSGADATQVETRNDDTTTLQTVCTYICTNDVNAARSDPFAALAAALLGLSLADRARLAAVLLSQLPEQGEVNS